MGITSSNKKGLSSTIRCSVENVFPYGNSTAFSGKIVLDFDVDVSIAPTDTQGELSLSVKYARSNADSGNVFLGATQGGSGYIPDPGSHNTNLFVNTLIDSNIKPKHSSLLQTRGFYTHYLGPFSSHAEMNHSELQNLIADVAYGKTWNEVKGLFIANAGVKTVNGSSTFIDEGIQRGQSKTYATTITDDDVDDAGNFMLSNLAVQVNYFNLGWDGWQDSKYVAYPTVNGYSDFKFQDWLISVETVDLGININSLRYYPGAIMKNGVWESSNRNDGFLKIYKNGQWVDVDNSFIDLPKIPNKGFIRKNGWKTEALIGAHKDERYN